MTKKDEIVINLSCAPNMEGLPVGAWEVERDASGKEFQVMRAAVSSDRLIGNLRLSHKKDAIDLSRFERPFPILFGHKTFIGTGSSPRVENGQLTVNMRRSVTLSEEEQRVWDRVDAGEYHSMSITAKIPREHVSRQADGTLLAEKWSAIEASVTAIPDDFAGSAISREFDLQGETAAAQDAATEDETMSDEKTGGGSTAQNVLNFDNVERTARELGEKAGREDALRVMREVKNVFARPSLQTERGRALCDDLIERGASVEEAQRAALDLFNEPTSEQHFASRSFNQVDRIEAGQDAADKWYEGASEAIAVRAGVETDKEVRREVQKNDFYGLTVLELARSYLQMTGDRNSYNRDRLVEMICQRSLPTHGSSDFPSVFANVANKAAIMGWDDAPRTWRAWCRVGNLTDFKPSLRLGLGGMSDLEVVPASGELPGLTQSDVGENIQLTTHGGYFGMNRQAIINDDLNEFADTGRKLGMAAGRVPQDLAYGILFSNPTLSQNGNPFFSVANNNIVTTNTTTGPDVDQLNAIELAMAKQRGPDPGQGREGNDLNIEVQTVIVPAKFKSTANTLAVDQNVPGSSANPNLNIWANRFTPVSEVKIDRAIDDTVITNQYYSFANPAQWPAVEVAFLDGVDAPRIEEIPATSTILGMVWRVYLDVGAAALDYRPAVRVDISA